jgi:putative aldouronate transport system substrate-binding protein
MIIMVLAGCNNPSKETEENAGVSIEWDGSYPIKTDETLTYWMPLNANVSATTESFSKTKLAEELERQTGVKIEYIHPTQGQEGEQLNLMLASGDLADIIENSWNNFPGGPEKALAEEYIIPLNDIMDQYAPNLKKYLQENPEIDKMVKTDQQNYYVFPYIRGDELLLTYQGIIIRQDWLDELDLEMPVTIDDWYEVLKAFKEKKKAEAPLSFDLGVFANGAFIGAYGITKGFYVEDGQIKYGPIEPEYKEFLMTMAKWFDEGLLDQNAANIDGKTLDANMLSGKSGATVGLAGSGIGRWMSAMQDKDPNYSLVPAPYPVLKKGDKAKFGHMDMPYTPSGSAAISSSCKNVELAARYLDFGYSEEGYMLYNFGIKGESYNIVDGYPAYTDIILKNPELSIGHAMGQYIRANQNGPFVQAREYIEQYYQLPQQKKALEVWMDTDAAKYKIPMITPTTEESEEMAKIMNDINTLVDEWTNKFIMGVEPLSKFDEYIAQAKSMNIERAIEIQQSALERYASR